MHPCVAFVVPKTSECIKFLITVPPLAWKYLNLTDYDFLSDDSMVLKVITIYNKDTDSMEEVLLEELQVFKVLYFEVQSVWLTPALQQLEGVHDHINIWLIHSSHAYRCCRFPSERAQEK